MLRSEGGECVENECYGLGGGEEGDYGPLW